MFPGEKKDMVVHEMKEGRWRSSRSPPALWEGVGVFILELEK